MGAHSTDPAFNAGGPTSCDIAAVGLVYCPTPTPTPTPVPPPEGCSTSPNFFGNCDSGYTNNGCNGCCSDAERDGCTSSGGYFYARAGTCQGSVCFDQQYECMGWGEYWNMYLCQCTGPCPGTPILVDVLGDGFKLTSGPGGVNFDLNGDGSPERLSWTAAGADDAWLVFDRDGDGVIGKGAEMFGNFTYQPNAPAGGERHGLLALAEFDWTASGDNGNLGGNADGVIDEQDAVFSFLRLWRDVNHNGVSEAGELHPLPDSGLASIRTRLQGVGAARPSRQPLPLPREGRGRARRATRPLGLRRVPRLGPVSRDHDTQGGGARRV